MNLQDGKPSPHTIRFTPEGKAVWTAHYNAHCREMNHENFSPLLRGTWGKYREYAGRFCLILALLHHAADPTADPDTLPSVGPDVTHDAWRLVSYFKSHPLRVRAYLQRKGVGNIPEGARLILNWIKNHRDQNSFTERSCPNLPFRSLRPGHH